MQGLAEQKSSKIVIVINYNAIMIMEVVIGLQQSCLPLQPCTLTLHDILCVVVSSVEPIWPPMWHYGACPTKRLMTPDSAFVGPLLEVESSSFYCLLLICKQC